jgi:hypothetical protein
MLTLIIMIDLLYFFVNFFIYIYEVI